MGINFKTIDYRWLLWHQLRGWGWPFVCQLKYGGIGDYYGLTKQTGFSPKTSKDYFCLTIFDVGPVLFLTFRIWNSNTTSSHLLSYGSIQDTSGTRDIHHLVGDFVPALAAVAARIEPPKLDGRQKSRHRFFHAKTLFLCCQQQALVSFAQVPRWSFATEGTMMTNDYQ